MRTLSAALALALLACGGPTEPDPEPDPTGPPSLAIVSGDNQEVAVTDTLPFDAVVQVMRGGEPVADQLVDWRVLEDNAGEPFVTTTRTDSTGTVKNRVIAGTRAHTHPDMDGSAHMEVRWVEQSSGEAIVDTTITFRVLPGEIAAVNVEDNGVPGTCLARVDTISVRAHVTDLWDQYDNPVPLSALDDVNPDDVRWSFEDRQSGSTAEGPSGSGWEAVVSDTALANRGYFERERSGACTDMSFVAGLLVTIEGAPAERINFVVPAP